MDFYHLLDIYLANLENNYTATKGGINASKKIIHKAVEATGKFLGNKIADTVTKLDNNKVLKT